MKYLPLFLLISLISCKPELVNYTRVILEHDSVFTNNIQYINEADRALISGFLFAYGNECLSNSEKNKCKVLHALKVENECDPNHISFIKRWFKNDAIMQYKLRNCPNLPHNFAIQNSFKKIVLKRYADTLSIQYSIIGLNNSQEKSWTVNKEDYYLIKNRTFIKQKRKESKK